jgi:hypothetical protein
MAAVRKRHAEPDEKREARHEPNAEEQANLDAVAAGHPNAGVLAAVEAGAALAPDARGPNEDGSPREMLARVVDAAAVLVQVGDITHLLTPDEAHGLSGAIDAIKTELVR